MDITYGRENHKSDVLVIGGGIGGLTAAVSIKERDPALDGKGNLLAYTKPIMVLVDELSGSGGDMFPATIQINRRGPLFGMRTMGAGGSVGTWYAGVYGEGLTSVTMSLMHRGEMVSVEGYPATPYVENVGVHPEIVNDYMTRENLLTGGRPFVDAFLAAMVDHINESRQED
jgi:C-terminal processing protease CtpA/Prc